MPAVDLTQGQRPEAEADELAELELAERELEPELELE